MIRVTVTSAEYDASSEALRLYRPEDVRDFAPLAKVREKLANANEQRAVAFTNKEASVLMDALGETEDDAASSLFEKLAGRSPLCP